MIRTSSYLSQIIICVASFVSPFSLQQSGPLPAPQSPPASPGSRVKGSNSYRSNLSGNVKSVCVMNRNIVIFLFILHGSIASLSTHIFHTSVEKLNKNSHQRIYEVKWFNQTLDHFTFTTNAKFRQKYLVNDTYWNK